MNGLVSVATSASPTGRLVSEVGATVAPGTSTEAEALLEVPTIAANMTPAAAKATLAPKFLHLIF